MISATGKKAFSLLELLVATSVLSIGIIVTLQALSFCAKVAAISLDTAGALFLAEDKMQEWEFKEKNGLIAGVRLEDEGVSDKFKWLYRLEPEAENGLRNLNLRVVWKRGQAQEEIGFYTYLRQ